MRAKFLIAVALALLPAANAIASETIQYTYDAKGRLTQVQHSGTVNNGLNTTISFDQADNRTLINSTGSPFSGPPQRVIVTPLMGLSVLILPAQS